MDLRVVKKWFHELPLASKCLLLFGAASALIIVIALMFPLFRMNALVGSGQLDLSRTLMNTWRGLPGSEDTPEAVPFGGAMIRSMPADAARERSASDPFLALALRRLGDTDRQEWMQTRWDGGTRVYRFARAERAADGTLRSVHILERRSEGAAWQLIVNVLWVIAAGSVVLAAALVVFALIADRLILTPVESLKETAERVREGHLDTRSDIETGDEFEELAETFNLMLAELERGQTRLESINAAMDLKLSELAEANLNLYESTRAKGEFVASVSHELRTPLNSIIGFTELLLEFARSETAAANEGAPVAPDMSQLQKRERYLVNIVTASRTLLEMIESLLEMAKIEAGRVEVTTEPVVLSEVCQSLVGLIYPLARKKGIEVDLQVEQSLPVIETDVKKLQQIVFNLLSNAVKFSARDPGDGKGGGHIVLRAEALPGSAHADERVRVSVIDDGPGIPPDEQDRIFAKFHQVDAGHTRTHAGTGLGLAIVTELTALLGGEIQLVSEVGRGSMFSLILPVAPAADPEPERPGPDEPESEPVAEAAD